MNKYKKRSRSIDSEMSNSRDQLNNDQNLDYSFPLKMKLLVNNEKNSDVSFSVGEKKQIIFGNKAALANGKLVNKIN